MKELYGIILAILSCLSFSSCLESTLEANAFKALRPAIKDPSSYELISIEPVVSLTEYDNINNAIQQHVHMQEITLSLIDEEIKNIIMTQYDRAKEILTNNMAKVHVIAKRLFEAEKIDGDEVREIMQAE